MSEMNGTLVESTMMDIFPGTVREWLAGQALANPEIVKFAGKMQEELQIKWTDSLAKICIMAADTILLKMKEMR